MHTSENVNNFAYICNMHWQYEQYKGIHPGIIIARELRQRALRQRSFALSVNEHPQTFNAITKGRRSLNTTLALKIECALGLKEGALVLLQAYYDIQKVKEKSDTPAPAMPLLREALFWDTDISRINWEKQYKAVIERVLERGNEKERKEIIRFYGKEKVAAALQRKRKPYSLSTVK